MAKVKKSMAEYEFDRLWGKLEFQVGEKKILNGFKGSFKQIFISLEKEHHDEAIR